MIIKEGEIVCLQGDRNYSFYIVKSGALTLSSKDDQDKVHVQSLGPGSTFGEFSLIAQTPMDATVRATQDSEIKIFTQANLHEAMENQPIWLKSILSFLVQRHNIAQENKRKSDLITTFPSLLFILSKTPEKRFDLKSIQNELKQFSGIPSSGTYKLLSILQDFKLVRIQTDTISVENKPVLKMLYETLRHRAIYKSNSSNILSLTDQSILTSFVKAACDKGELQAGGRIAISTNDLIAQTKRTMHGMSLTQRNLESLLQRRLLQTSPQTSIKVGELPELDSISKIAADFDTLLNLLELNRIYPQLDKKLLGGNMQSKTPSTRL